MSERDDCVPVCVGLTILRHLVEDGYWQSAFGRGGVIAADELYQNQRVLALLDEIAGMSAEPMFQETP